MLGLHLVNGLLLWRLARRWLSPIARLTMLTLFWLHPIQTEAVAYISGGLEVLLGTYVLLALWGLQAGTGGLAVALGSLGLAVALKWSALPLLLVVPMLGWTHWSSRVRWAFGGSAAIAAGAIAGMYGATFAGWLSAGVSLDSARLLALALWRYLALVLVPYGFSIEHDWRALPEWLGWAALLLTLVVGLLSLRRSVTAYAAIWIVGLVGPRALIPDVPPLKEHHVYTVFLPLWLLAGLAIDSLRKDTSWLTSMRCALRSLSPTQLA